MIAEGREDFRSNSDWGFLRLLFDPIQEIPENMSKLPQLRFGQASRIAWRPHLSKPEQSSPKYGMQLPTWSSSKASIAPLQRNPCILKTHSARNSICMIFPSICRGCSQSTVSHIGPRAKEVLANGRLIKIILTPLRLSQQEPGTGLILPPGKAWIFLSCYREKWSGCGVLWLAVALYRTRRATGACHNLVQSFGCKLHSPPSQIEDVVGQVYGLCRFKGDGVELPVC